MNSGGGSGGDDDGSSSDDGGDDPPGPRPGPARAGDLYLTLSGNENDTMEHRDKNDYFFHQAGVTQYLRHLVALGSFHEDLNDTYLPRPARERLQRAFHLPVRFVDSFTEDWNVLTIFQSNITRDKFYILVIIHNGRYDNELEVITHMSPLRDNPYNLWFMNLQTMTVQMI